MIFFVAPKSLFYSNLLKHGSTFFGGVFLAKC